MCSPDLLLSASPSLSEQLRRQTDQFRSKIVKANYNTQFAQNAAELAEFRDVIAGSVDAIDDGTLSETFQKTVPLTTYESYAPFIARLLEKPCKASDVVDLFAPGLPDYIAESSSTSGRVCKSLPKYRRLPKMASPDTASRVISDPLRRRTIACVRQLWWDPAYIEDENSCPVKTVYVTSASAIHGRMHLDLHPEEDRERMGTFIFDHAAPYATNFVAKMRSFLLIHALFALGSRSLEAITIAYSSTFVDMMRHLDTEFDVVLDCLASGAIPDLDGIADIRHHLETNMVPDPERAAELRSLGRPSSRPGWCGYAWPNLRSVTSIASGSFATYVPLVRWFLGPNIEIRPGAYGSSEGGLMALPYTLLETNQYKLADESLIEFLDVTKGDSISALAQAWETEVGKRYEIVLTTTDGLWRYRLGDLIEISGFDPTDGVPIFQVIGRRNIALHFSWFMVSEAELSAAILSMAPNTTLQIVGWTAIIDDRIYPTTIGFFTELAGDQATDLTLATQHVLDELSRRNGNVTEAVGFEVFRKPTIRVVQPGTFSKFLQLKLDEANSNRFGQIKVPPVVLNEAHIAWFSDRVVREL